LRLTRGPAGNRTTTGSLSASPRTTPYQLSRGDTSKLQTTICPFTILPRRNRLVHIRYLVKSKLCNVTDLSALFQVGFSHAYFFPRFEAQKRAPSLILFRSNFHALRPSRPASKPALTCFVLISMVSRHWSSRQAARATSHRFMDTMQKPAMTQSCGVASKFGYGSARGDPDVWIGLGHLRFGMDRGYGSACGFRVWIGALHFDSQPCGIWKVEIKK